MFEFQPPQFDPHPFLRGGHLQTIVGVGSKPPSLLHPVQHLVPVSDGDTVVVHEDRPQSWGQADGSILLVHGIAGCHAAPYMIRLAVAMLSRGIRVFRMDMRGCGAGAELAGNLAHAGRSDDVLAVLARVAELPGTGPLGVIGISLGANQLLRAVGRIGAGIDARPDYFGRISRIAAVAPPVDLQRCSDNLTRWSLRPYNYYFIRSLLSRAPQRVKQREDFQRQSLGGRPRTLRELDDRFTAPLSGFRDAAEYYSECSAAAVARFSDVPTLVLASQDDPLVPIGCFVDDADRWSPTTKLVITKTGGHVGFIDRRRGCWMDQLLQSWFEELVPAA